MTPERWNQLESAFDGAADLDAPARSAYLDRVAMRARLTDLDERLRNGTLKE